MQLQLPAGGAIPAGLIVMWSGALASVPAGWALCDGTLGTPDLRERFIKGWSTGVNPGGTGGSAAYTPAGVNSAPAFTGSALGSHAHELPLHQGDSFIRVLPNSTFGTGNSRAAQNSIAMGADSNAQAVLLSQAVDVGTPAGTVAAPTFTGTPATIEPPFFKLAYLMKL